MAENDAQQNDAGQDQDGGMDDRLRRGTATPRQAREDMAEPEQPAMGDLGDAGQRALEAERKRARDFERELKVLRREVEQERSKGLSEAERLVADAEKRGESAAATRYGQRLARERFVAAAARRNPDFDASAGLSDLNTAGWLDDDGEPNDKAIKAAVEKWVPSPKPVAPSFDGGARTSSGGAPDMNSLLRQMAGR